MSSTITAKTKCMVSTLAGMQLSYAASTLSTFSYDTSITLNRHHEVFPNDVPDNHPVLRYFTIGIGGCYNIDDTNRQAAYQPTADELGLYRQIPFRCVPIEDDLTDTERAQYGMRVEFLHSDGARYVAYYFKKLKLITERPLIVRRAPDGVETPYELDSSKLTPPAKKTPTEGAIAGIGSHVTAYVAYEMEVTDKEVLESISVLFNGDTSIANINEYGLIMADECKRPATDANGTQFEYRESIYSIMAHKLCTANTNMESTDKITKRFTIDNGTLLTVSD